MNKEGGGVGLTEHMTAPLQFVNYFPKQCDLLLPIAIGRVKIDRFKKDGYVASQLSCVMVTVCFIGCFFL